MVTGFVWAYKSVGGFTLLAGLFLFLVSSIGNGNVNVNVAYADKGCDLPGKDHDDNNPSSKKFREMAYNANMCEIAICVDNEECENHTTVDIDKFKQSNAYLTASEEVREEIDEYAEHGSGASGLVGYEILEVIQEVEE